MIPLYAATAVGLVLLVAIAWIVFRLVSSPKARDAAAAPRDHTLREIPRSDVMAGGLAHMALADLLQFLAQGGHSGTLEIDSGRRSGTIRLVQGLVTHAEFRREQDLDAMFELLSLKIGDFRFRFETPPDQPVRGREVVDILMLWLSRKENPK